MCFDYINFAGKKFFIDGIQTYSAINGNNTFEEVLILNYYSDSIEQVIIGLNSSESGLSETEAEERIEKYGPNALVEKKRRPAIVRFFSQFADAMIIVLLIAATVSAGFAIYGNISHGEPLTELIDSGIILVIVIINAVIGYIQENKAENALEGLREKNKPFAKVIRDGEQKFVPSERLTVGDVIVLEAGDIIPADMRLIHSASLKIEEAALTGESVPTEKHADTVIDENAPLGDRTNMAYLGGTVTYGRGRGVVTEVGMNTEMGKIANMLQSAKEEPSPLNKQLAKTAKVLSIIVLIVAAVIFAVSMIRDPAHWNEAFMTAVAIAVAAIPEGLPAVVTIVLATGVQKMSRRNAIVKNLPSVETLGCCEVICSDKTGTLTLNRMTVKDIYMPSENEQLLKDILSLCNDTVIIEAGLAGDPTETALVSWAFDESGGEYASFTARNKRVDELPFDSKRKLMTTVNKRENGTFSYTKGAPDILLARCGKILTRDGVRTITPVDIRAIEAANTNMANHALRVLAAAYAEGNSLKEENLIFVGLVGMIDPPRPEVKAAVEKCRTAGMKPLMITGDHPDTARAIAAELGILEDGDLYATGAQLDKMSDEELNRDIAKYSVFARVSPENKIRIVKAFKNQGKVTAMTGDGVNDAPSIKEADIGIGMGITGTQVSKEASDIVLADDNFATIVDAVEEGRKIFTNITKAIQFLLSANIAEVLCLFIATVILGEQFLTPVMILWVNLITDSFPALSLGTEAAEQDVMSLPPRKNNRSLLAGAIGRDIFLQGIFQTALVLTSYIIGEHVLDTTVHAVSMTMAFVSLCFIQLFHAFNLRSQKRSILNKNIFSNKYLNLSLLTGVVLTVLVVTVPAFNGIFHTAPLNWQEWITAIGVAFAIIPLVEFEKLIVRIFSKKM